MSKWPLAQARESGVSPALLTVPVRNGGCSVFKCTCDDCLICTAYKTSGASCAVLMPLTVVLLRSKLDTRPYFSSE